MFVIRNDESWHDLYHVSVWCDVPEMDWNQEMYVAMARLLHSPSLVALGLSVVYETWPPIVWNHPFVIGWIKYKSKLSHAALYFELTWLVGIPTVSQKATDSSLAQLALCKGTVSGLLWKTVKESMQWQQSHETYMTIIFTSRLLLSEC